MNEVYKVKETATGATKVIVRDDQFDPPIEVTKHEYGKLVKIFRGIIRRCYGLGTNILLNGKWLKI